MVKSIDMWNDDTKKTVFYVKIIRGYDLLYLRRDLPANVYFKWEWFFRYRAALYQIETPKIPIGFKCAPYTIGRTREEVLKIKHNRMIADKRMITKLDNELKNVIENWSELWPIDQHPKWGKTIEKIEKYRSDYVKSKSDYEEYLKNNSLF